MIDVAVSHPGGADSWRRIDGPAEDGPPVSCLMVSRGDRPQARLAIDCFRRQAYPHRELVIACDRDGTALERHVAGLGDPSIRFHRIAPGPLGTLRNRAVALAEGEVFCQWDDDDLCTPERIGLQLAALTDPAVAASMLLRWTLWAPAGRRLAVSSRRQWEGSLMIRRSAQTEYPPLAIGEDFELVAALRERHPAAAVDAPWAYAYVVHGANTCGAWHMRQLFDAASETVARGDYDARLAALGQTMPVAAYAGIAW